MNKTIGLLSLAMGLSLQVSADATHQITTAQAKAMYSTKSLQRVSVHDPSVTYDAQTKAYYVFGSHKGVGKSTDLQNWTSSTAQWGKVNSSGTVVSASNSEAFVSNQVKTVTIGGKTVDFGSYNCLAWVSAYGGTYNIDGNMWAPDIIYNPVMKKWCMYLSLNGPYWNSAIILLTADAIDGKYVYQGPVVFTGFYSSASVKYANTDAPLATHTTTIPARYNQSKWGNYWPHAIDPCVFYDENGKLWMSYGSWSGGIWMLEMDENTGLRDYDVTYTSDFPTKQQGVTSDPYFGKKISGGYYVSGEGSYIRHIGSYYYLFVSNGGYAPDGGYEMRVFRSANPDGPYLDGNGTNAIFTSYKMNYGKNGDTRGEKILGAYNKLGFQTVGECAQGHNSVLTADDGRSYLVYHTKFNDGTVGHQVRVHQLFVNQKGWLVAAPFEYAGETANDDNMATQQKYTADQVAGTYQVMIHKYGMDYANMEEVTPVTVQLQTDGTVSGTYTGTWNLVSGTSYIEVKLAGVTYYGVVCDQTMNPTTIQAISFTGCSDKGVNVWGYKMREDYNLAYQINNTTLAVKDGKFISANVNLYGVSLRDGINIDWTSSNPNILSNTGKYNPTGLTEDTPVDLICRMNCGDYYWADTLTVTARKEYTPTADYKTGMEAYYNFDAEPLENSFNKTQTATLLHESSTAAPQLTTDYERSGQFVHESFGAYGYASYVKLPNPLYQSTLSDGMTVAFWMKTDDTNLWDALFSFYNSTSGSRFYFTGNTYLGYNGGTTNWLDVNYPTTKEMTTITPGEWQFVVLTLSRTNGYSLYVGNSIGKLDNANGMLNGTTLSALKSFDYNLIVDHIQNCPDFYFGYGSYWGSAAASFDDLFIYNRVLSVLEINALKTLASRVFDFSQLATGIETVPVGVQTPHNDKIYNINGCEVAHPCKGIYIQNGKKMIK